LQFSFRLPIFELEEISPREKTSKARRLMEEKVIIFGQDL
jgi:hypothetical protein